MKRIIVISSFVIMVFAITSCVTPGVYVQSGKRGYGRVVRPYNAYPYDPFGYGYRRSYRPFSYDRHNSGYGRSHGSIYYGGTSGHYR